MPSRKLKTCSWPETSDLQATLLKRSDGWNHGSEWGVRGKWHWREAHRGQHLTTITQTFVGGRTFNSTQHNIVGALTMYQVPDMGFRSVKCNCSLCSHGSYGLQLLKRSGHVRSGSQPKSLCISTSILQLNCSTTLARSPPGRTAVFSFLGRH